MAIRYYCGHCGRETRSDARVCPNCGGRLYHMAGATTPETDVPTPQPRARPYPVTQPYAGTRANERLRPLWLWFSARPLSLKIALVIVVLALSAALSPLLLLLDVLALAVCLAGLVIRVLMRRPSRSWVLATVASFLLIFVFSGVSNAVYGPSPPPQGEAAAPEKTEGPPKTTRAPAAKPEDGTESQDQGEGQAAAKPEPEPKSKPEPEPELKPKPEPAPKAKAQEAAEKQSSRFDATVTVSRVVDGDTTEIFPAVGGVDEVRLIGVDTPETKHPDEGIEPYGPEASAFATNELTGRRVGLEFGLERIDQYDRLLAYIYAGGEMFNEDLLEEGYAQAYSHPPNTKYESRFAEAQEEARAGGLGIWGLSLEQQCQLADRGNGIGEGSTGCDVVAEESASASATAGATASATAGAGGGGAVPPISEEHCPQSAPIKGNESSGIYHMPDDAYYDATHPEECFATPQDAEAAGYRAAKV